MAIDLTELTADMNIAAQLSTEELNTIGQRLCELIQQDDASRHKWLEDNDNWLKLAEQVAETKSHPWPNASNVKFPLLSTASIQFHARAMPALLGNRELVRCKILGVADENKAQRASRVSRFMSIQLIDIMDNWIEEMDRLLFVLPIVGLVYKKTYYSPLKEQVRSDLILPRDVIVNYYANDPKRARITHRLWQDANEIMEFVNSGIYLDADLGDPTMQTTSAVKDLTIGLTPTGGDDDLRPYEIYESHCFWDLDGDGYKEPYVITIAKDTQKVLRIVARWEEEGLILEDSGKVIRIEPVEYFTTYRFLPDPESKTHGLGFGRLIGPTGEAVNTIINQLVDAGTLSNMQAGFLAKGVRVKGGSVRFRPGEWKVVQTSGDDLRNGVFPLPIREPSNVLFQLLGLLIRAGQDLVSVQEALLGRNPGQNQPFSTTQEVIEQGLKVFNGIYKRIYRALTQEYQKIYNLNRLYLPDMVYINILDDARASSIQDFSLEGVDILPSAEPDMVQETEKIQRANDLVAMIQAGLPLNPVVATKMLLESRGFENVTELMELPPPQPSLEEQELQFEIQKFQDESARDWARIKNEALKTNEQALRDRASSIATLKEAEIKEKELGMELDQQVLDEMHTQRDEVLRVSEMSQNMALERMKDKTTKETAKEKSKNGTSGKT